MFDYGVELNVAPVAYKLWPTEGSRTALIDADLIPYMVAYTVEDLDWFKAKESVEQGLYSTLAETPECISTCNRVDWTINNWVEQSGCDSAKLFLTDSGSNFRLDVAFTEEYKGKRVAEKPAFFDELKQYIHEKHNAIMAVGNEADDLIVTALYDQHYELEADGVEIGSQGHKRFSTVVAVSSDKDLRMAAGWHYDPRDSKLRWVDYFGSLDPKYKETEVNDYVFWPTIKGEPIDPALGREADYDRWVRGANKGEAKVKRVLVGKKKSFVISKLKGTGLKFFYAQILMGDSVDCYAGCKGVGATGAYQLLDSCTTEEELYARVLQKFIEVYGDSSVAHNFRGGKRELTAEQLLTEQGRLAYMQRTTGEVWNKDVYLPLGTAEGEWK